MVVVGTSKRYPFLWRVERFKPNPGVPRIWPIVALLGRGSWASSSDFAMSTVQMRVVSLFSIACCSSLMTFSTSTPQVGAVIPLFLRPEVLAASARYARVIGSSLMRLGSFDVGSSGYGGFI